jgi:tetratricopeptide (TPR) repeat protein
MDHEDFEDDVEGSEAEEEMALFLADAVGEILLTEDSGAFLAWMRAEAPGLLPVTLAEMESDAARRAFVTEMGRAIWNAVPLPGRGFRTRPLPRPERNEPCPCGSGAKYKKCCGIVGSDIPFRELDPEFVWTVAAERLPLERIEELAAGGKIPRASVGDVATRFLDAGNADAALALVAPLFEHEPERLDERDAAALDVLLEAYGELGLVAEREDAIEYLNERLRPALRAVLWENVTRQSLAEGDVESAREAFERARRDDPESPALGPLEVTLLMAEENLDEAGERARFWLERARRQGLSLPEGPAQFLQLAAEDPRAAWREMVYGDQLPLVQRLERLIAAAAERPIEPYGIVEEDGPEVARLEAPAEFEEMEDGWLAVYLPMSSPEEPPQSEEEEEEAWEDDDLWEEETAEEWLSFLEEHPRAFDSLLVLQGVAEAVEALEEELQPETARSLLAPALDRAVAILDRTLADRPEVRLPWAVEGNELVLEMLAWRSDLARQLGDTERGMEMLERLRVLDPEDHHDARVHLARELLLAGQTERALEMSEDPDNAPLSFTKALALHRLGRRDEALAALEEAADWYPEFASHLTAQLEEAPEENSFFEAWQEAPELVDWLRGRFGEEDPHP